MITQTGEFYAQERMDDSYAEMDSEFLEFDGMDDGGGEDSYGDNFTEFEDPDDGMDASSSLEDFEEFGGEEEEESSAGEDAEFLGLLGTPIIRKGIGSAIRGISNFVRKSTTKPVRLASRRYTSGAPRSGRVTGIPSRSRLMGRIATRNGRSIPFRLPSHIATKGDVFRIRKGVNTNGKAIRSLTKGVKANAKSIIKVSGKVSQVDRKHAVATTNQNRVLSRVNRRVLSLKRELDAVKQQAQTQMMLPLLMGNNDLSSITVTPQMINNVPQFTPSSGVGTLEVTASESDGDNMLPLMMMMSGGMGGSSGGGMMNNPMMMFMLMEAMKD